MYVEKKLRKLFMDWWIVPLAFSSSKLLDRYSLLAIHFGHLCYLCCPDDILHCSEVDLQQI